MLPAADSVLELRTTVLAAYATACPDVTRAQAMFRGHSQGDRFGPRTGLIDVRCGEARAVAVRIVYTGVTVPDIAGSLTHQALDLACMLGLSTRIVKHAAEAGELSGHVLAQRPAAGAVVPFGTTLLLVEARAGFDMPRGV